MKRAWKIILWLIIIFNAGTFLLYGFAKLYGLQLSYKAPAPDRLLKDVPPLGIMWYFYSIKHSYAVLIAFAEIIPAILILIKRTRFIGALFYLFGITNILAINIIFGITNQTLLLSVILFINTLIILVSERGKLIFVFSNS